AWGLMVPLIAYLLGPELSTFLPAGTGPEAWGGTITSVWRFIVRPIAVGGMLVGTAYTLYTRRQNIFGGLAKAFAALRGGSGRAQQAVSRTERYMSSKTVFMLIAVFFVLMTALYIYMTGLITGAIFAAVVMIVAGFFFATVSGYLVGLIG